MVMMKQRIVGSQSEILSMLNRLCSSTRVLTGFSEIVHYIALDFVTSLLLILGLGTIAELYKTYEMVFKGFTNVCFVVLYLQGGPLLVYLLV